jgi:hypothetical protein
MATLQMQDTDQDPQKMAKLNAFKAELESKRIVKYWDTVGELVSQIKDSVNHIVRRKPAIGWIRGDQGFDPAVYKELEALRKENESLKKRLNSSTGDIAFPENISHGSDPVIIEYIIYEIDSKTGQRTSVISRKALWIWDEILIVLTNSLYGNKNEHEMQETIEHCIDISNISADDDHTDMELSVDDDDGADIAGDKYVGIKNDFIERVRFQFEALGLITSILKSDFNMKRNVYWEMTEKGRKYISGLNAVRRVPTQNNANG